MADPTPPTGSGGELARIRCIYCGANNFENTAECWQCHRALSKARAFREPEKAIPPPAAPDLFARPVLAQPRLPGAIDTTLATRAAAALGMIFPWFGFPVGIVLLMTNDERWIKLGWTTILWSGIGTFLSVIVGAAAMVPLMNILKELGGGAGHMSLPGGGLPNVGGDSLIWPAMPFKS